MKISRRIAMLGGLSAAAAAGSQAASAPESASGCEPQRASDKTHVLRHYVFATRDFDELQRARAGLKSVLDLYTKEPRQLVELGFSTSMALVGKSTLELVGPFKPGNRPKVDEFIQQRGDAGIYKLVFQTFDAAALRRRIYAHKLKLERDEEFRGQQMISIEPEFFGTHLEIYQYTPLDRWWGYDGSQTYPQSSLVEEIVGCEVAVENPGLAATFVAELFQAELDPQSMSVHFQQNRTLPFERRSIRFRAPAHDRRGVVMLDLQVKDRSRVGEVVRVCGADFRFV